MIELTVRPARTSFSGPERELKQMFKSLRVRDEKGAWWRAKASLSRRVEGFYEMSYWEQKTLIEKKVKKFQFIKFYDRRSDTFASGLLFKVEKYLNKKDIKYVVNDKRRIPSHFKPIEKFHFDVEHRKEQVEAVNAALTYGRGLLHCATNTGKTIIAAAIIEEVRNQL